MKRYKQGFALVISIIAITAVHYTTETGSHWLHLVHLIFRVLYVVPLICAAYWYRLYGALLAFCAVTAVYLPHVFLQWKGNLSENMNQLAFIGILFVVSFTTSMLSTLELSQRKRADTERERRLQLQRYLSPLVVDEVLSDPNRYGMKGKDFNVSVLFADICEFTRLSEPLPPSQVMEILNRIFQIFGEVIFKNEGTINQIAGDAVMAIFGAPKEQSDHADRAARAAIELQKRMGSLTFDTEVKLKVKVGINSGRVTAGSLGPVERMEYTVIGDAVNLASRLCTSAKPDQIIISATTHSLLKADYSLSNLGSRAVKGRTQRVEVFSIDH